MATPDETISYVEDAASWDERVARIRLVPQRHGTGDHQGIYARIARDLYVPHLGADFAYVHASEFYELGTFDLAYQSAADATDNFSKVAVTDLRTVLSDDPTTLLPLRVMTGLTKSEFAASTEIVAQALGMSAISSGKVDAMERRGTRISEDQATVVAETVAQIMAKTLFGTPPGDLRSKQDKPDTEAGWETVQDFATNGVPYSTFLHQRHYGGAFRQLLDATSTLRGDLIEDAVEDMFTANGIKFIRTGSHNQHDIEDRFEVQVKPAPDFVVYDDSDTLRALLECKGANDGGTARDKAVRFERLRDESTRLGGVPLIAVLGGLGWLRVNDTLGPIVRDCDGRVFSVANLDQMMEVAPFPGLLS